MSFLNMFENDTTFTIGTRRLTVSPLILFSVILWAIQSTITATFTLWCMWYFEDGKTMFVVDVAFSLVTMGLVLCAQTLMILRLKDKKI